MILSGVLLRNVNDGVIISGLVPSWSKQIRAAALAIIFLRSGLEIDLDVSSSSSHLHSTDIAVCCWPAGACSVCHWCPCQSTPYMPTWQRSKSLLKISAETFLQRCDEVLCAAALPEHAVANLSCPCQSPCHTFPHGSTLGLSLQPAQSPPLSN